MTSEIEMIDAAIDKIKKVSDKHGFLISSSLISVIEALKAHREKLLGSVLIPRADVPGGMVGCDKGEIRFLENHKYLL